jgi:hypothetical protein
MYGSGQTAIRRGRDLVESAELWRCYRSYFYAETGSVRITEWNVLKTKVGTLAASEILGADGWTGPLLKTEKWRPPQFFSFYA